MKTITLTERYVEKLADCLQAHSKLLLTRPAASQVYLMQVVNELRMELQQAQAANSNLRHVREAISVEWCEGTGAFSVSRDGAIVEWFPLRRDAENFANELATGAVNGGQTEAHACN